MPEVSSREGGGSREAFQVAYVGENPDDHTMDVEDLGPALLAFGRLIRAANQELNQGKASVKLLVTSDFEHKCFNINFEVVQAVQQIRDLLDGMDVESAKALLKYIGIISTAGGGLAATVFGYLKWKKGRKVESAQEVKGSPDAMVVKVEGDNAVIHVNKTVFQLSNNNQVLEAVEATLAPIQNGKDVRIEFRQNDTPLTIFKQDDVEEIVASCEEEVPEPLAIEYKEEEAPKAVTATLYTYSPVFDAKAHNWRFLYRRKPIYADIRETTIASDAVRRGSSFANDRYRVKMEVLPPASDDGPPHYKIIEVLDFYPAEQQMRLLLKKRAPAKKKKSAKKAKAGH